MIEAASSPGSRSSRRVPRAPGGALVLGADYRALGVVRSLGRRGVRVEVLRGREEPLAGLSRYACAREWPDEPEDRLAFLLDLAADGLEGWALIPSGDESAALVARHHERLARQFALTTPSWDVMRWAYDKRLTYQLAEDVGVPCPRTALPARDGLDAGVPFPAVLKPAFKQSFNRLTAAKAWRVDDAEALARSFAEASALVDPATVLLQEVIPGGGDAQFSLAALLRDGEPLASLTARRTRQYPADVGRASTYVETVDYPEVVELSLRLLQELRWTGLVEVEFKRDPRDGTLKLLDVNPRVWGWHTLGARAGVDFSYLLWLAACDRPVPATNARAGVGWLRLTTDTPTALRELLGGRLALGEYARSLRGPREAAIFAWDDPVPGVLEVPALAYVLWRRLVRREGI